MIKFNHLQNLPLFNAGREEIAAYAAYAAAEKDVATATRKAAAALVDWRAKKATHDAIFRSQLEYRFTPEQHTERILDNAY